MPATDTKEHPIIFNEWSINRILAGEKTQTRRVVEETPWNSARPPDRIEINNRDWHDTEWVAVWDDDPLGETEGPVYGPGPTKCPYGQPGDVLNPLVRIPEGRLRLRVEDVRVERVQDITPEDAQAEGIELKYESTMPNGEPQPLNPVGGFKKLWNDIHGDGAWDDNPWVWVIKFSPITT